MERYTHILHELSALGVLAGAFVIILVGSLWYSSFLFGRAWMRHCGIRSTDVTVSEARRGYFFGLLTALFQSFLVGLIVDHASDRWHIFAIGIGVLWLFIFLELLNRSIWERAALGLVFIHAFRSLATLMACAFTYHLVS